MLPSFSLENINTNTTINLNTTPPFHFDQIPKQPSNGPTITNVEIVLK